MYHTQNIHIPYDADIKVERSSRVSNGYDAVTVSIDKTEFTFFGTPAQLDELAVKMEQTLTDSKIEQVKAEAKAAFRMEPFPPLTNFDPADFVDIVKVDDRWVSRPLAEEPQPFYRSRWGVDYFDPVDWDRVTEDDLALRGYYDQED